LIIASLLTGVKDNEFQIKGKKMMAIGSGSGSIAENH